MLEKPKEGCRWTLWPSTHQSFHHFWPAFWLPVYDHGKPVKAKNKPGKTETSLHVLRPFVPRIDGARDLKRSQSELCFKSFSPSYLAYQIPQVLMLCLDYLTDSRLYLFSYHSQSIRASLWQFSQNTDRQASHHGHLSKDRMLFTSRQNRKITDVQDFGRYRTLISRCNCIDIQTWFLIGDNCHPSIHSVHMHLRAKNRKCREPNLKFPTAAAILKRHCCYFTTTSLIQRKS